MTTFLNFVQGMTSALAWPVLIGLAIWKFRTELGHAIDRVIEVSKEGVRLADRQDAGAARDTLAGSTTNPAPSISDPWFQILQSRAKAAVDRDVNFIENAFKMNSGSALQTLSQVYVIRLTLERLQHSIFGSQIELIEFMTVHGNKASLEEARRIWDRARVKFSTMHVNRTFEQWIGFLINFDVMHSDGTALTLTDIGQAFLPYLAANNLVRIQIG
jgi:hypothetical protein